MRSRHDRPGGFTLIELLVVIAIIALLVSILLPSLRVAKDLAHTAICKTNLRSDAMAVPLYANDFNGYAVPETITSWNTDGGPAPHTYAGWMDVVAHHAMLLGQYTNIEPTANHPEGLFGEHTSWHCPGSASTSTVSYSMAHRITASGGGQFFAAVIKAPRLWSEVKQLASARHSSRLMVFCDKARGQTFGFNGSWPLATVPFYGNHKGAPQLPNWDKNLPAARWNHDMPHPPSAGQAKVGTNFSFLDGHAATLVNEESDIAGEYWLKPLYGEEFVIRPEDAD